MHPLTEDRKEHAAAHQVPRCGYQERHWVSPSGLLLLLRANYHRLIESPCPLIALSLEGGKSDLQLREDIAPLLVLFCARSSSSFLICKLQLALGSNESLASLDISGHAFGNFGAAILGKSLQVNCVLKRLWMDENAVTLQGLSPFPLPHAFATL